MNATKSEHFNSAHMTFPSHLITSIQFTSASHARPQSIKHAPWQRRSCPIITPIIKVQELWVKPSWLTDETNRFLNSSKRAPDQKPTKAGHSNITLKNKAGKVAKGAVFACNRQLHVACPEEPACQHTWRLVLLSRFLGLNNVNWCLNVFKVVNHSSGKLFYPPANSGNNDYRSCNKGNLQNTKVSYEYFYF